MDIRFYDKTNERRKRTNIDKDFELQLSAPSAMLAHLLENKVKDKGVKQLNIFCNVKVQKLHLDREIVDGFWDIEVPYDPNILLSLKELGKKKAEIRHLFSEVLSAIFEYKNWDMADLKDALIRLEENDFSLEFLLKDTPKKSPDKKHLAIVICKEEIHSFKMICRIYDRAGILIAHRTLVETMPNPFEYARFLGKPSWDTNKVFSVNAKSGNAKESIHI